MRKNLYWLSVLAVFASCSDDMIENASVKRSENATGIQFHVVADETRGMVDTDYSSFFFAEYDRVGIYADNVADWPCNNVTGFTKEYIYKATRSHGNPYLTGIDYSNVLEFYPTYIGAYPDPDDTEARFFITYPTGQNVTYAGNKFTVEATNLSGQSMYDGYMNFNSRLLYQYTTFDQKNVAKAGSDYYGSTGESIDLSLKSPLYMLRLSMNDVETYSSQFGVLKSVSVTSANSPLVPGVAGMNTVVTEDDLTTIGGVSYLTSTLDYTYPACTASDLVEIPAESGIFYIKATCKQIDGVYVLATTSVQANIGDPNVSLPKQYQVGAGAIAAEVGDVLGSISTSDVFEVTKNNEISYVKKAEGIVNKATLTIRNTEITNGTEMNLFVLPVKHNGVAENYVITYKFDKVWLTYTKPIKADFNAGATGALPLTIADEFQYIVTMGNSGSNRSLIVNKGTVKAAVNAAGNVIWNDEYSNGMEVDPTTIDEVIINADVENLTDADWAALNKLTAATKLTIKNGTAELKDLRQMAALKEVTANNVTTVGANAFSAANAATIKKLSLANATSIKGTVQFSALTDLNLGSYTFTESDEAADRFFNNSTKNTLVNVDIHSVTSLAPVFGYSRNILFTDYTALKTIKLNSVQTIISAKEFKGCSNLKTVEGVVEFSTATSAFEGCSSLQEVKIAGTVIPAAAFKDSGVKNVKNAAGQAVVPSSIGKEAFSGDAAIVVMDLTEATTIAEGAFKNASAFVGNNSADNHYVVTLNVTTVEKDAFNGTAIKRFQLRKATVTKSGSLNSAALLQIKYRVSPSSVASDQVALSKKEFVDIFVHAASDASMFDGYRTVTLEDFDW